MPVEEIRQMLGELKEGMRQLQADEAFTQTQRQTMNSEIQKLQILTTLLSKTMEENGKVIANIETTLGLYDRWQQRGIGMFLAITSVASVLGGLLTLVMSKWFRL